MSAPFLWIILPLIVSIGLFIFQQKQKMVVWLAAATCFLLGLIALLQPIDSILRIGPVGLDIKSSLIFLGRGFFLDNGDRFFLTLVYFMAGFWFLGSRLVDVPPMFVPIALATCAILTGALAVEPFLYAAVLIELAAILVVPLFVTRGKAVSNGLIRFMVFQAIAMLFVLFAGWLLGGSQASVSDEKQLIQASVLLGVGFAFWLAVFPFHTWMPMLMHENHPYVAGFILTVQPLVILILMVDFLNGFVWLRDTTALYVVLRTVGVVMVVTGGVWAAFQQDVRRLFGYAVIVENGFALVAIGAKSALALNALFYSFLPRIVGLTVLALSLSLMLKYSNGSDYQDLKGFARKYPLITAGVILSAYSLMGFPNLAGFPVHLEIFELSAATAPGSSIWLVIGIAGLFFSITRLLSYILGNKREKWTVNETLLEVILISGGILAILLIGILPNQIMGSLSGLLANITFLN